MKLPALLGAVSILVAAGALHAGCGSDESGSAQPTGGAGGTGATGGADASLDGEAGAGGKESGSDAGSATALATGSWFLLGLTSDDRVIAKLSQPTEWAEFSLSGDKKTITTSTTSGGTIRGSAFFVSDKAPSNVWVGKFRVWSGGGLHELSSTAWISHNNSSCLCDASPDGSWVAFSDGAVQDGTTTGVAKLVVSKPDGTAAHVFATGVRAALSGPCSPVLRFGKSGQLFAGYCDAVPGTDGGASDGGTGDGGVGDAGAGDAGEGGPGTAAWHLVAVDPASGAVTELATASSSEKHDFHLDPVSGTKVAAIGDGGALTLHDVAVTAPVSIAASGVVDLAWTDDASAVLFVTSAGALQRASASASPNPSVLVAQGVGWIHYFWRSKNEYFRPALSPDGKWVLVSGPAAPNAFGALLLASAETPGTPVTIAPASEGADLRGSPFSSDGAKLLYLTGYQLATGGNLMQRPVAAGTATGIGSGKVSWHQLGASGKLVFDDNFTIDSSGFSFGDVKALDLGASGAEPQLIRAGAATFFVDSTGTKIVFGVGKSADDGIYVAPIP